MTIDQTTTTRTTTDQPAGAVRVAPPEAAPAKASGATFESLAIAGLVFGIFAMAIAVFAVGLAARAVSDASKGGGGGGTAPATLDVDLADFSIKPGKAEISTGGDINIVNKGAVEHDLVVEDKQSAMLDPGAEGDLNLEGLTAGTYEMYCDVPGHRAAGMQGTIVVK